MSIYTLVDQLWNKSGRFKYAELEFPNYLNERTPRERCPACGNTVLMKFEHPICARLSSGHLADFHQYNSEYIMSERFVDLYKKAG